MAGCAGIQLPNSDLCIADTAHFQFVCYNLANDYTASGARLILKPGAVSHVKPFDAPSDAKDFTCMDPTSWANAKAFMQALADKYAGSTCN